MSIRLETIVILLAPALLLCACGSGNNGGDSDSQVRKLMRSRQVGDASTSIPIRLGLMQYQRKVSGVKMIAVDFQSLYPGTSRSELFQREVLRRMKQTENGVVIGDSLAREWFKEPPARLAQLVAAGKIKVNLILPEFTMAKSTSDAPVMKPKFRRFVLVGIFRDRVMSERLTVFVNARFFHDVFIKNRR